MEMGEQLHSSRSFLLFQKVKFVFVEELTKMTLWATKSNQLQMNQLRIQFIIAKKIYHIHICYGDVTKKIKGASIIWLE